MDRRSRIPVTVLTGYLGSGKTTLLNRLLRAPEAARAAVLINEFGEIGLDHLIVERVSGTTVLLRNGCICCSIRSDLKQGLQALIDGRSRSDVPEFDRILIETTGLADPVPLVQTIAADPMLRHQVELVGLVATVDALNGAAQLAAQPEAERQAATADRLVITKTDLAQPADVERLAAMLAAINPSADILRTPCEADLWDALLAGPNLDPARRIEEGRGQFQATAAEGHTAAIRSFVFHSRDAVDWSAFAVWLSLLVHRHGANVLRVKGLLNVRGARGPVLLNAVQNFIHPPVHLDAWPDDDVSSRLVFILQGIDAAAVETALEAFLDIDRQPARHSA
jgi:G3E family GTPase